MDLAPNSDIITSKKYLNFPLIIWNMGGIKMGYVLRHEIYDVGDIRILKG